MQFVMGLTISLPKYIINSTRFVGVEVSAVGSRFYEFCSEFLVYGTAGLSSEVLLKIQNDYFVKFMFFSPSILENGSWYRVRG
jgi:hypothetical protein